jgi:hypothetical protein
VLKGAVALWVRWLPLNPGIMGLSHTRVTTLFLQMILETFESKNVFILEKKTFDMV